MKNKGFTLVELMAVIIILGLIAVIAVPIVTKILSNSKDELYERQVKEIEDAAKRWGVDNIIDEEVNNYYVSLLDLRKEGYLESTTVIKNPKDDSDMNGCVEIKYDNLYKQFTYKYKEQACPSN